MLPGSYLSTQMIHTVHTCHTCQREHQISE
uniref:Uncharacterized protein n=1 Tax=Anguilla anguilla TaxID=7936 RepID=A0A0E9VA25_ANGAN